MLDRTQRPDTPYEDDSNPNWPSPPEFTAAAEQTARQVVPLRGPFTSSLRRKWPLGGMQTHPTRFLGGMMVFALAGSLVGGFVAAVDGDQNRNIDPTSVTTGIAATPQPESQIEIAEATAQMAVTLRPRPSRARKAYRVATTDLDSDYEDNKDNDNDKDKERDRKNKRERKLKYWDDIDQ